MTTRFLVYAAMLTGVWAALTASANLSNLIIGFGLSVGALAIIRTALGAASSEPYRFFRRPFKAMWILVVLVRELILAGLSVGLMAVRPRIDLNPGIVAVPLDTRDDFEIALFANLITMVPGTMTVDVSTDKSTLYMHVLDATDPDYQRNDVKSLFERNIIAAFGS
ncbi:MAG: Na+/H+ antiporter subunit E [Alphaproteobacteria bacterium]